MVALWLESSLERKKGGGQHSLSATTGVVAEEVRTLLPRATRLEASKEAHSPAGLHEPKSASFACIASYIRINTAREP